MILFLLGLITGIVLFYSFILFKNHRLKGKRGKRIVNYRKSEILRKLRDTLRHMVFEYNIKRENQDFSLNIHIGQKVRFQVLHRSHFPDLAKEEGDIDFGLALYLPVNKLSTEQREQMLRIFREESETFYYEEVPFDYHIVDLGKDIRYGGYLLTRILKEVFDTDRVDSVRFELFSEGEIPYFGLSGHPKKSD